MPGLSGSVLAIEVARRKRDDLAKHVAHIHRTLWFAQDQLAQLQNYAGDTDAKWAGTTSRVLSTELMRHHYQFMARLQNAIHLQLDVVAQTRDQLEKAKQHLLQAEFRMASLSQLLQARQGALRLREARREQRQSDEFAALLHARTRAKAFNGEVT